MQPFEEIESSYKTPDPWGFQTHPDDRVRKEKILSTLGRLFPEIQTHIIYPFFRALDLGAGEGWITKDLPAAELHAYEISKLAKSRLPSNVVPVEKPEGNYDLVIATGVLYRHYDCETFFRLIREHASSAILTCNIATWEHPEVSERIGSLQFLREKQIYFEEFSYREYRQRLRVFKK